MDKIFRKTGKQETDKIFRLHQSNDFLESKFKIKQKNIDNSVKSIPKRPIPNDLNNSNPNQHFFVEGNNIKNSYVDNNFSIISGMDALINDEGEFIHANFNKYTDCFTKLI